MDLEIHLLNGSEILPFLTKWSNSHRETQIYAITYTCNLKKQWYKCIYIQNRKRSTDMENKLMVTTGKKIGGGRN